MIRHVMRLAWLNFMRDRVALMLAFVLPVVFFSIFASIFAPAGEQQGQNISAKLKLIVVDEDHSVLSQRLLKHLGSVSEITLMTSHTLKEGASPVPYNRDSAWQAVRRGHAPVALVILPKFRESLSRMFSGDKHEALEILYDPSDPIALPAVVGILQASVFEIAPDVLMGAGLDIMARNGAPATPEQTKLLQRLTQIANTAKKTAANDEDSAAHTVPRMLPIKATDVHASPQETSGSSTIAYYASGISVMFLLFSLTSAAGSILEENEFGTLERLLTTQITMQQLIIGKGCFYALVGWLQIMVMFIWASTVFGMPFWTPFAVLGSSLVALFTAATAAAFGLFLASISRTRAQLSGLSTIVILTLSALGGSMVPKMLMPPFMQAIGRFTFNGQALDAFLQVFWHVDPTQTLGQNLLPVIPHLAALILFCAVFLVLALRFAKRWETM